MGFPIIFKMYLVVAILLALTNSLSLAPPHWNNFNAKDIIGQNMTSSRLVGIIPSESLRSYNECRLAIVQLHRIVQQQQHILLKYLIIN